jgi:hypothetical protein
MTRVAELNRRPVSGPGRLTLLLAILLVLVTGCGKKGPPVLSGQVPSPAAGDLAAQIRSGELLLTWSLPDTPPRGSRPSSYIVYRFRTPTAAPFCADCPLLFKRVTEVPVPGDAATGARLRYTEALVSGYRYFYKVAGQGPAGAAGADSNVVDFTY